MKKKIVHRSCVHGRFFAANMIVVITLFYMLLSNVVNVSAAELLPYAGNNLKYALIKNSSVAATDSGFVRIMNMTDALYIEECDDEFQVTARKKIDKELSIYGGFYSGTDAYYFVFGQNNTAEDTTAEVVRVVKYSKKWERLGAACLTGDEAFGHQVRYPFDYGNVSMEEYDGILYIVTGHEGYVDPQYNQGHQGFLMFAVDESTMTGSIKAADLWHSFSQHLAINDSGDIYVLEESDGDRMTKVTRYKVNSTAATKVPVLKYGGTHTSAWAIPTYATANAIAISDRNVLAVGTSIDQTRYDDSDYTKSYNIYLTITPMDNFTGTATTIKWLTSDNLTSGYRDVKLTKINDNRFLICWEQKAAEDSIAAEDDYDSMSTHVLHYEFVDGNGNVIGSEHKVAAAISECEPVVKDGKVVFYSSDGGCVAFYTIDAATGAFRKKLYKLAGENAEWDYSDGILTVTGSGELYAGMGSTTFSAIKDKVTKLVVGDGITKINEKSFYNLSNLTEVSLGKDITDIGDRAFGYCAFKEIRIPRGVKTIGNNAFYGNQKVRSVYIPNTVETIGEDILWTGFYWTSNYAKVVYATIYCDKVSTAASYAEEAGIKCIHPTVTLQDQTVSCTGEAVTIDEAAKTVTTGELTYTYYIDQNCTVSTNAGNSGAAGEGKAPLYAGTYYVVGKAASDDVFSEVTSDVVKLVIHHTVEEVAAKAATCTEDGNISYYKCSGCGRYFYDEEGLSAADEASVIVPALGHDYGEWQVTSAATQSAYGIETRYCKRDSSHQIMRYIPKLTDTVSDDVTAGSETGDATSGNEQRTDVSGTGGEKAVYTEAQMPEDVGTKISDDNTEAVYMVVASADGLPSVAFVESDGGSSVKSVVIPDTIVSDGIEYKVTAIADYAFGYNTNLTKVKIGNHVTKVGAAAFTGCSKLKTVTIGENVTTIGDSAFSGCKALTKIILPEKTVNIGKQAFKDCKKLKTIIIKSKKLTGKTVSKNAFKGVSAKTVIKVPKAKKKAYTKLFRKKGLSQKVKVKSL